MSVDWPIVRLGNYCSKIGSGATPRGGASVYLNEGEICLIRSQNIYNDGFKPEGLVYITEESAEKLKSVVVENNDILLNITGDSVARVCLSEDKYLPARVNQHVAIIRPDPKEFDARYLRYLLVSPAMQSLLLTIAAVGATRNALTKNMIETLEVSKPPLYVQVEIANNLELLDKKIQLNRQTNQTLENIAQAIFKSWFVDFDPTRAKAQVRASFAEGRTPGSDQNLPEGFSKEDEERLVERAAMAAIAGKPVDQLDTLSNKQLEKLKTTAALFPDKLAGSELGEIPEGWGVESFLKVAKLDTASVKPNKEPEMLWEHFSIPAYDVDESPRFEFGKDIKSNKYKVDTNAILSSKLNPATPRTWWPDIEEGNAAICSTEFMQFVPHKPKYRAFILGMILSKPFQEGILQRVTGSTGSRQRAQPPQVANMEVVLPSEMLIKLYSNKIASFHVNKARNIKENVSLAKIRDTLLPKLLSGELSINSANKAAL